MMPTLSIIVPAYNAELYLVDCINSILNSEFKDYEIIIVDDGSADRTGSLCDKFAEEQSNISVFHTRNRGLSQARNLGIDNAKGKFIGFVEADDIVAPDMFGTMVNSMAEDIQLSICDFHRSKREDAEEIFKGNFGEILKLN